MSSSTNSRDTFAGSPLRQLSLHAAADHDALLQQVSEAASHTNSNAGKNTYLHLEDATAQAHQLPRRFPDPKNRPLLYGLPVSLKDCFDLAGTVTTVGSRYYAQNNPIATTDSWMAQRLRNAGAVIIGKTHMQELAYGITGENPWFGDCLQPRDSTRLTGGSSSGAAASVQEGSAFAAIGTDTGGSIRAPAAFCDLVGFRTSLGIGSWEGGWHLAPSFDTIGCLFRDLRDGPLLAAALFGITPSQPETRSLRIGIPSAEFLSDCEPSVTGHFEAWRRILTLRNHTVEEFAADFWQNSFPVFSAIQAHEAAALHRGHYEEFESAICDRLTWGASLTGSCRGRISHPAYRFCFAHGSVANPVRLPAGTVDANQQPGRRRGPIPGAAPHSPLHHADQPYRLPGGRTSRRYAADRTAQSGRGIAQLRCQSISGIKQK